MRLFLCIVLLAGIASAGPAPYPLTIDSRAQTVPKLIVSRAGQAQFDLSYKDGASVSSLSGCVPFMSWATNASASTVVTAQVVTVTATSGTARATFTPASMNYTPGRYIYEVGVLSNSVVSVYRQGIIEIIGSPYATGGTTPTWTTNVAWSLITGTPTTMAGYGITDGVSSTTHNTHTNLSLANGAHGGGASAVSGGLLTYGSSTIGLTTSSVQTAISVNLTNSTALYDGVYLGTNGVFFTRNSTNFWILFN